MSNITLHPAQSQIFSDLFVKQSCRYAVAVCTRGFGKSYLAAVSAIQACAELMALPADVPNKNVALIAPTYQQAVDIYHPLLAYQLGLEKYADKHSSYAGKFWLPNNVELRLWSYESTERMRGTGQYFVVCDEVSSWEHRPGLEESWNSIIRPCITTRWSEDQAKAIGAPSPGRALIISTPKGYNYLYDMYNFQDVDEQWKSYHYTYESAPHLSTDEIEKVKYTIDPLKFAREYEASFEDSGNTVFYNFNRKEHITTDIPGFYDGEDVHVAIDFNVSVMAASAFAVRGGQMHFIKDYKGLPDTATLASRLRDEYRGHTIYAYPDPSGRARKTSAAIGQTDFRILEDQGIRTRARRKAPPIADSVQAVNTMLKNAAGQINMYFRPECKNTISSIERTMWVDSTSDNASIDKSLGDEHHSDGVRYACEYLFPVGSGSKRSIRNSDVLI